MLGCFQAIFALTTARLIADGQKLFYKEKKHVRAVRTDKSEEIKVCKKSDFMDEATLNVFFAYGHALSLYVLMC